MEQYLQTIIWGNSIKSYLIALIILVATYAISLLCLFLLKKAYNYSNKVKHKVLAEILRGKKLSLILLYLPIYIAAKYLMLPKEVIKIISNVGFLIITFSVIAYLSTIIGILVTDYLNNGTNRNIGSGIRVIVQATVWVLGIVFVLSNMGFNVTTLITGLGIGGIALALASQTVLADVFNYFTITFDRPFDVGDIISVGDHTGTVKSISFKGTRLVSVDGEEIVISNTDITKSVLKNFYNMSRRREVVKLGLRYDTQKKLVKELPEILKKIVEGVSETEFSRAYFAEFGDSSLNFILIYYVLKRDYLVHVDKVHEVNNKIFEEFASLGIEFAFPSQSVYTEK